MTLAASIKRSAQLTARQIIDSRSVVTHFQPIFSAKQKTVVGVEALSRGIDPTNDRLMPPSELFGMAEAELLSSELEELCRDKALTSFANLGAEHESLLLFLNVNTALLGDKAADAGLLFLNYDPSETPAESAAELLLKRTRALGIEPTRVAVEVLESKFDDVERLTKLAQELRDCGFLLVLDDVGAGHSNLDRIPIIRPDVLKIDRSLISRLDTDYHKQETVKSLAQLARKIGALVVAEGVETKQEALVSLELGADLLQGFYLARPQSASTLGEKLAQDISYQLAADYRDYMIRKINERKLQHRRYTIVLNTILCELAKTDVSQFDTVLRSLSPQFPAVECLYVLDEAGHQVSNSVCNFANRKGGNRLMFRPALKGADHSLKEFYYVLLDAELQKYTTDPYVSLASGNLCRTISTCFRDANNNKLYILCIDVAGGI